MFRNLKESVDFVLQNPLEELKGIFSSLSERPSPLKVNERPLSLFKQHGRKINLEIHPVNTHIYFKGAREQIPGSNAHLRPIEFKNIEMPSLSY